VISPAVIRANLLLGALFILFGGWYLSLTTIAPQRRLPYDPGIMFVPRILASGLILLSVLLIIQQIVSRMPRPKEPPPDRLSSREWLQTVGLFGLTVTYTLLLPWLGFLLVTPVYLVTAMLLSGARSRASTGVTAVIVTGVIYVSFVYFFRVSLPPLSVP
jgi:putative tricarboxylic transport membrane protein